MHSLRSILRMLLARRGKQIPNGSGGPDPVSLLVTRLEKRRVLNGDPAGLESVLLDVGDLDGGGDSDGFRVSMEGDQLRIEFNEEGSEGRAAEGPISLHIAGTDGDDNILVDLSGAEPSLIDSIVFDGGAGDDTLQVIGRLEGELLQDTSANGAIGDAIDSSTSDEGATDADSEADPVSVTFLYADAESTDSLRVVSRSADIHLKGIQFAGDLTVEADADSSVAFTDTTRLYGGDLDVTAGEIQADGRIESIDATLEFSSAEQLRTTESTFILNAGGDVTFTAHSILHEGAIEAEGGRVILQADDVDGSLDMTGRINVSNTAIGFEGGAVHLLGERVVLAGEAEILASGAAGGGLALIGGDLQGQNPLVPNSTYTWLGGGVTVEANALAEGDGGEVIVWADEAAFVYGQISARGGNAGGDGGFVETSGKIYLEVAGAVVDASAPMGSGGTWLLDPRNVIVESGDSSNGDFAGDPLTFTPTDGDDDATADLDVILAALDMGMDVVILSDQDIVVAEGIAKMDGDEATLTLDAARDIIVAAEISSDSNELNVSLMAGRHIVLNESVLTNDGAARLEAEGGAIVDGNGADLNISAASLILMANDGVGELNDALETEVDELDVSTNAGGVFLTNTGELNLVDLNMSDAEIIGGGVIRANSPLNINTDQTITGAMDFIAGNDNAAAGDNLTIAANISHDGNGLLRFLAGDDIIHDSGNVQSMGGTDNEVHFLANEEGAGSGDGDDGGIAQNGGALTADAAQFVAHESITYAQSNSVGLLTADVEGAGFNLTFATSGALEIDGVSADDTVSLSAGSIMDDDGDIDITATNLILTTAAGIGVGNVLETEVSNLDVNNSTSGGVSLTNSGALNLEDLNANSPATIAGGGSITANSPLNINTDQTITGSMDFIAGNDNAAAGDNLTIAANISHDGNGLLRFLAGDDIIHDSGNVQSMGGTDNEVHFLANEEGAGSGDGDDGGIAQNGGALTADAAQFVAHESITYAQSNSVGLLTADVEGAGFNLTFATSGALEIDEVSADDTVSLSAGSITDDDGDIDITATNLVLMTAAGIGVGNVLETEVSNLDVNNSTSGGVFLTNSGALNLEDLNANSPATIAGGGLITANSPLNINTDQTITGAMDFIAGNDNAAAGDNLTIAANISHDGNGLLRFLAGDDIIHDSGNVQSMGGTDNEVHFLANEEGAGSGDGDDGGIAQNGGALTADAARFDAHESITYAQSNSVGSLVADVEGAGFDLTFATSGALEVEEVTAADDTVTITAASISDDDSSSAVDITADDLILTTSAGIGVGNALETQVTNLDVSNSTSGGVFISNTGALSLADLNASAASLMGGGAIAASSPFVIDTDQNINGAMDFVAGNDNANPGDNLTIDANVTHDGNGLLRFLAGDDIIHNSGAVDSSGGADNEVHFLANQEGAGSGDNDDGGIVQLGGTLSADEALFDAHETVDYMLAGNDLVRINANVAGAGFDLSYIDTSELQIEAVNVADTVTITATEITGDGGLDVAAENLLLFANTGIGDVNNPLDTQVANLDANNDTSGGVFVTNVGALNLADLDATRPQRLPAAASSRPTRRSPSARTRA